MEHLGRHPDGSLDLEVLALGTLHQIAADCAAKDEVSSSIPTQCRRNEQRKWHPPSRNGAWTDSSVTFLEVLDAPGGERDADPVLRIHQASLEPGLARLHRRRVRHIRRRHGSWVGGGEEDSGSRVSPRGRRRRKVAAESAC